MLAVSAVRFVIWPQGRLCNGDATSLRCCATLLGRHDSGVRGSPVVSGDASETVSRLTRLANYQAVPLPGDGVAELKPRKRLPPDTLLALGSIIATDPGARGWYLGHFLRPMCLFRQPLPNRVFRPRNRPPF